MRQSPFGLPQLRVLLFNRCPSLSQQVRDTLLQAPMAFHLADETAEAGGLVERYMRSRADVTLIVIDVHAAAVWRTLHQFQPVTRACAMLVVGQNIGVDCAIGLFACGMRGAINPAASAEDLWLALHTVARGGQWYDAALSARFWRRFVEPGPILAGGERQVAQLVATGAENHEIASILGISVKRVERRIGNIMHKVHVRNRTALALWYFTHAHGASEQTPAR
ncbi:MAG: LuxR C-terminal-related transcriptional regulator [Chloroflexales bacterium]|nr:LuxR C-terminal-related transcriptional regulator [Chloroflexales bacterium]